MSGHSKFANIKHKKAKNDAAILFSKQNNMTFKFVFDQEINSFINELLSERDILSNIETILKLR